MVFQDGGGLVRENGHTRVPIVFDNLIHRDELPVTVGLFVKPGVIPPAEPGNLVRKKSRVRIRYSGWPIREFHH